MDNKLKYLRNDGIDGRIQACKERGEMMRQRRAAILRGEIEAFCPKGHPYHQGALGIKTHRGSETGYCKFCSREAIAKYRDSHPEVREKNRTYKKSEVGRRKRREWRQENVVAFRKQRRDLFRKWMKKCREIVFAAYGKFCSCCGEDHEDFLTLDHINDDGSKHRKEVRGGLNIYKDVIAQGCPRDKYRILCMNCNWGRRFSADKKCPHETESLSSRIGACG